MDSNNQTGPSALKRFGIPLLLLIAGFVIGGLHASTLNCHGEDAGYQGIAETWDPLESTCRHASLSIL